MEWYRRQPWYLVSRCYVTSKQFCSQRDRWTDVLTVAPNGEVPDVKSYLGGRMINSGTTRTSEAESKL